MRKERTEFFFLIKRQICSVPEESGEEEEKIEDFKKKKPMMKVINCGLRREISCGQKLFNEFLEYISNI